MFNIILLIFLMVFYSLFKYVYMYFEIQTAFPPFFLGDNKGGAQPFKLAKNDLIAELKLSHNVGGVSKLRSEQQKMQEEQERAEYRRFLAQFTMENFLEKVIFENSLA